MNEALVVIRESGKVCGNVGSAILAAIYELTHNHQARIALRKRLEKDALLVMLGALIGVLWLRSIDMEGVNQTGRVHIAEAPSVAEGDSSPIAAQQGSQEAEKSSAAQQGSQEAEMLAKLLWGIRKNSERDLRAVCWVVFNRIESPLYPNTLEAVIEQPSQWVSYYADNPATAAMKKIAAEELANWKAGVNRPISEDTLWFNWSAEGISFREDF